jgi:hypothetical protein
MNVETITMDPTEARERLRAYRGALHKRADAEYEAAAAGYEALAEGTPLVRYEQAIRTCPRDEKGRPMLAIARADRQQVLMRWSGRTATFDAHAQQARRRSATLAIDVNMMAVAREWTRGYALVPMVPPEGMDKLGGALNLRDHLILWEVEEWADLRIGAVPDRDPLLLRPIHGDLCAVVHAWDLTDLERAVMAGRAFA